MHIHSELSVTRTCTKSVPLRSCTYTVQMSWPLSHNLAICYLRKKRENHVSLHGQKRKGEQGLASWLRERNFILHWPCLKLGYQRTHKLAIQFHTISYNFIQFQMRTHPIFWTENFETYLSAPSFFFPAQSLVLFAEAEAFA